MTNYKNTSAMTLLDSHIASGTESTYTWTPSPAITPTKYKEIIVIMAGGTTATLNLQVKFSGLTTAYYYESTFNDSGVLAISQSANQSQIIVGSTIMLDAAKTFHLRMNITLNDPNNTIMFQSLLTAAAEGHEIVTGSIADTTLDSIQIFTSTSTWITGTHIYIYGLL